MHRTSTSWMIVAVLYVLVLVGLVGGLIMARRSVLADARHTATQDSWQDWRAEAERQQDEGGPVARRVPKSAEPPTLVLLRDHFATTMLIVVALSSAVYFAVALMIRGVFVGPGFQPDLLDETATH